MPSEHYIRNKAKEEFEKRGWIYWFPPKIKFHKTDIFGCFDCLVIGKEKNKPKLFFLQLTSASNMSARIKKINDFLNSLIKKNLVLLGVKEVWGWHSSKKEFKIFRF